MSKTYKIKVNQGQGEAQLVDIPVVGAGGKPLTVKAVPGGKYQLQDASTGFGPENIRASRVGKNLLVFFEGRRTADLVIEDYYDATPEGFNNLIGEAESGRFYEYIPETAQGNSVVSVLSEGTTQVGMALGGAEINPAGAAVGTLVAAAGLNPLLLAPLALLGAAGGGGGGGDNGGGGGDTPPNNNAAKVEIQKMTLDTGVADNDFVTQGPVTEFSGVLKSFTGVPGDKVKLELLDANGKPFDPVLEAVVTPVSINGVWTWKWVPVDKDTSTNLPEAIQDGSYTLKATIVSATGTALTHEGASTTQLVKVDSKADEGDNRNATLTIETVSDDTGVDSKDWVTSDTTLVFSGKVNNFKVGLGDAVKLELVPNNPSERTLVKYVDPKDGVWIWDATGTTLPPGGYKLTATLVDQAGNAFTQSGAKADKPLLIDAQAPASGKGLAIDSMTIDSGLINNDFKTNDNTPVFKGSLTEVLASDEWISVQLLNGDKVEKSAFIKADASGKGWTWAPEGVLPDATYTLKAQVVDQAGNPAKSGDTLIEAVRDVVIDTKGPNDPTDPNEGLKTETIKLMDDKGEQPVFDSDYVTSKLNDGKLLFEGVLNKNATQNGVKVLVKIVDEKGGIKSSKFVDPKNESWTYEHVGDLADGQYLAKTILLDPVGNIISASDQSFLIDSQNLGWGRNNSVTSTSTSPNVVIYNNYYFSQGEYGRYIFNGVEKIYTGGYMVLDGLRSEYSDKDFKLEFIDQAGNSTLLINESEIWKFGSAAALPVNPTVFNPKDFTGQAALGAVGTLTIFNDFDMAQLYDGIDAVKDQGAASQVVMGTNTQNLKLNISLDDVLTLGVTNSFSVAQAYKGKIQLLIDGQSGDVVNLSGLKGSSGEKWGASVSELGLFNQTYKAYTNDALGAVLFIDKDITINVL